VRLAIAVPEEHVKPGTLNAGLEVNTRVNEEMLEAGQIPTFREAVAAGKVKWKPEPPGEERFDHAGIVLGRGWGDCDDLAPWHAASLRASGEDPDAMAFVRRSGPTTWHALVKRGDGTVQDPSKAAGMGGATGVVVGVGWAQDMGARPAVLPTMFPPSSVVGGGSSRPAVAARCLGSNLWEARADTPWQNTAYGLASLSRAPVAAPALVGAILGSVRAAHCAGVAEPAHLDALMALAGILDGHDPEEVAEIYGDDETEHAKAIVKGIVRGLSFGKIFHAFEPLTAKLVSFIPGVGPIAASALDITDKLVSPQASIPPPPPPTNTSPMPPKAKAAAAAAAAAAAPIPPPPGEALPAHFAAMESFPGGPWVMRF